MKFRLLIDKNKEEEIVATVHAPSDLTAHIEDLVLRFSGTDKIAAFNEDTWILLPLHRIECITVIDGKTWAIDDRGGPLRDSRSAADVAAGRGGRGFLGRQNLARGPETVRLGKHCGRCRTFPKAVWRRNLINMPPSGRWGHFRCHFRKR